VKLRQTASETTLKIGLRFDSDITTSMVSGFLTNTDGV